MLTWPVCRGCLVPGSSLLWLPFSSLLSIIRCLYILYTSRSTVSLQGALTIACASVVSNVTAAAHSAPELDRHDSLVDSRLHRSAIAFQPSPSLFTDHLGRVMSSISQSLVEFTDTKLPIAPLPDAPPARLGSIFTMVTEGACLCDRGLA